eukprot:m.579017 g.579017  ORF g.579017 m.579017 type:complete len:94 (+) comp57924_c0_seq1:1821-2102(+)
MIRDAFPNVFAFPETLWLRSRCDVVLVLGEDRSATGWLQWCARCWAALAAVFANRALHFCACSLCLVGWLWWTGSVSVVPRTKQRLPLRNGKK